MQPKTLGFWIATALLSLGMLGSGLANVLALDPIVETMARMGFPDWFPRWHGSWKIAGAVVLLAPGLPRLKEWAHAGFTITLSSAAVAHLLTGDSAGEVAAPLVFLALNLTSWALRPEGRRLA